MRLKSRLSPLHMPWTTLCGNLGGWVVGIKGQVAPNKVGPPESHQTVKVPK